MSKKLKRCLSLIMTFLMILVTVPLPELKVFAAEEHYGIWIGNEEFTSEHLEIEGKQGKATIEAYGDGGVVKFSGNFIGKDGDDGIHKTADGRKFLLYVDTDKLHNETYGTYIELQGNAKFASTDPAVVGLGADDGVLLVNISEGADICFDTAGYGVYTPKGDFEVRGKLTVNLDLAADSTISAIYANILDVRYGGETAVTLKNKKASGKAGSCSGIHCADRIENYGKLTVTQGPDDGPVHSGLYVDNLTTDDTPIVLDGDVSVYVYGDYSVAIGNEEGKCGAVLLRGNIAAHGGLYAFFIHHGMKIDEYMEEQPYIEEPEDGIISNDGKTIFNMDGDIPGFVRIRMPEHYKIWVGEHEVTAANRKAIPGVVGGKATYNPNTSTLMFEGNVTGVEGIHNGALIEKTEGPLNIEGNATLENTEAADGIKMADDTIGKLTINGELDIKVKSSAVYVPKKDLVVNGKLKVNAGSSASSTPINCNDLQVKKDALVELNVTNSLQGLYVEGDMSLEGSVKFSGTSAAAGVWVYGNLNMDQGWLEASNSGGLTAVLVNGNLTAKDSYLKVSNLSNGSLTSSLIVNKDLRAEDSVILVDGKATGLNVVGLLNPTNSTIYAVGTEKNGISCKFLEMSSGKLEAEGGEQAIVSTDGFDLKSGVDIALPSGGKIVGKDIVEADGTTPAKHVLIDGGTYYNVWVDGRQISDKNADDIFPENENIDASYDPVNRTLTFKGEGATLQNLYIGPDLIKASIYADQPLKIVGKVNFVGELYPNYGIYVNGNNTLTLEDADLSFDYEYPEAAISVDHGALNVWNSSVDAKAAVIAGEMMLDNGYVRLADQGHLKNAILEVYGDVDLEGNSRIEASEVTDGKWGVNISGWLDVDQGSSLIIDKSGSGLYALSAQKGMELYGGSVEIHGSGDSMNGLDQTAVWMGGGGSINIELTGKDCIAADCNSGNIEIENGSFTVKAGGIGSRGITADILRMSSGRLSVESYDLAVDATKLQMQGGMLSAESTKDNGQAILLQNNGFDFSEEVGIVEPEDGDLDPSHTTIVDKDGKVAAKVVLAAQKIYNTEDAVWNLFTRTSASYEVAALGGAGIQNSNKKSAAFYNATLYGNMITVSLKEGVNRKKAASPANCILQFELENGEFVEYVMPVEYKKPTLKLTTTSVTIHEGADTLVNTQVLCKNEAGIYTPFFLYGAKVKYGSIAAIGDAYGYVQFHTTTAGKGAKLSIQYDGWESPIELKFNVQSTTKDVLSSDLPAKKTMVINKTLAGHNFQSQLWLNGQPVTGDAVEVTKGSEVAGVDGTGRLFIQAQATTKPGNYTVEISQKGGSAKLKYKVKVSDKPLDQTISLKVVQKYDVVTGQAMVITPVCKDAQLGFTGWDVECSKNIVHASRDLQGNMYIYFDDNSLTAKNLNIGDMKFTLKHGSENIVITLKNVKAKKTTPKVRTAAVPVIGNTAGKVNSSVNILCTYKDKGGNLRVVIPNQVEPGTAKGGEFVVNEYDRTEVNVKTLTGKSGSVKLTLTFNGGVTKTVTVKAKKAKKS